jgi:thymidylate synthase
MTKLTPLNNRFLFILDMLWNKGSLVKPRGLLCREIVNFQYYLMPRERFMCFDQRKLKLDYVKQEFMWYLRGQKNDTSIAKLASIWKDIINKNGTINSNYGYYIFDDNYTEEGVSNFERIARTLEDDPDSRRAAVTILHNDHLNSATKDVPCTAYINFLIRKDHVNMYVRMRSQDAIFGMGNDAPCFSFIQELLYVRLKKKYPHLKLGRYWHMADSFHVYERHFELVQDILENPVITKDYNASCPSMTTDGDQLALLRDAAFQIEKGKQTTNKFANWLLTRDDPKTLLGASYDH